VSKSKGTIWPIAISIAIGLVFMAGVVTVIVANKLPVQESDRYMMHYQDADNKANELIKAQIAFDKKYKIAYINNGINLENTTLQYKVTDLNSNPVNNANIRLIVTRPNVHEFDIELNNPTIANGLYTFSSIKLPKEGRWNFIVKVNVGDLYRFYNIKADTRKKEATQYE
jgi:hypothetical protein